MLRHNLSVGNAVFCVDTVQANSDGSFTAINATPGACPVTPPAGGGAPAGRMVRGQVIVGAPNSTPLTLDFTKWIWGYDKVRSVYLPFPQVHQDLRILAIPKAGYVAIPFRTDDRSPFRLTSKNDDRVPQLTLAISREPGNFGGLPGDAGSVVQGAWSDGGPLINGKVIGAPSTAGAELQPNTDYYINVKATYPDRVIGATFPLAAGNA
jgi:hypothetical protein